MKENTPAGTSAFSTMISTQRSVTIAVEVAGFEITGIPARIAAAAFSAKPQAGKLKALMWTATPRRGTRTCCPQNFAVRPS